MYETTYAKPSSLAEATQMFADGEDAAYLSGGHTLIPTLKQRLAQPSVLIDLTAIADMKGIAVDGDSLIVGAGETHANVAASSVAREAIGALACLAGGIGDPHVRNRGTMGGSVANNDPAADYPSAVLGLGATVHTNTRTIAADDFFDGMFATTLDEGEIITKIAFPMPEKAAYAKFDNPASRYAMAGVFVAKMKDGSVRVAVTGAGQDGVFRASDMEAALSSNFAPEALDGLSVAADDMISDMHGSAEYRANLVKVMAKRAVAAAS